ncbi:MAG TPA: acetylornithine deacetylase [Caulobacteraceae bacterium]|nr:acetylornithine deacetylase [Caulobacteraceae bacterium]
MSLPASIPESIPESIYARARPLLERLVSFDTVSHHSNLPLIAWVEEHLAGLGVASRRIVSRDGRKSNLLASVGPDEKGGVVLSGHTDVVPVVGQEWRTDPFVVAEDAGKLYGRGVADMKGFLALALAAVPKFLAADLKRPAHLAFSYDEEIGCFGAPGMIEVIGRELPRPALVVVGEPTSMEVVSAHKGITAWRVTVTGREAHSAQTHLGVSANMVAARLMGELVRIADDLVATADPASPFTPKGASLTIGKVEGGTAGNILAKRCAFLFDLRAPSGLDVRAALASFLALAEQLDAEIKAKAPEGGVLVEQLADVPPLAPDASGVAEARVRRLAGDNGPARVASFASEAGQFQGAGFPTVLCGPGSIDQAHQPDEFIEIAQLQRGAEFMARLIEELRA